MALLALPAILLIALIVTVVFAIPAGIVVTIAWNAVIPTVFGLPALDFAQGIALTVLAVLLIKPSAIPAPKD